MRVAVDATALLSRPTGVGVMARELLRSLGAAPGIDTSAFALSWRGRRDLAPSLPDGVRAVTRPMAARPLRAAWSRAEHPAIERWTGPIDVVHGPNYVVPPARSAARVVSVHDLTFVRYPELSTRDTLRYPTLIRRAVEAGAWVHTDAAFVAAEVVEHFRVPAERVIMVPLSGPDPAPIGNPARGRAVAGTERYILAVGTVEPRKDYPGLVQAFASLIDCDDVRLVIAGGDGWGAETLTARITSLPTEVRRRITRLGWVDDATRHDLLAGASVLAYPSRYEGFGLVPLEAMAAGVPVVTTDVGALPATVGDAAILVPVGDTDALAAALARVLEDHDTAESLRERGFRQQAGFSWQATAAGIIDLYRAAIAAR
ncbi:MAG: glycosyltransferase family 4 protein [Actinobacteria bacterium]|nr:glycosyltransferase family 4 protein [Actinomycetota bacterium]